MKEATEGNERHHFLGNISAEDAVQTYWRGGAANGWTLLGIQVFRTG